MGVGLCVCLFSFIFPGSQIFRLREFSEDKVVGWDTMYNWLTKCVKNIPADCEGNNGGRFILTYILIYIFSMTFILGSGRYFIQLCVKKCFSIVNLL